MDLQLHEVLTLLEQLKLLFLKAYNSLQQKYHLDIFHYFENRLGKDSNFRKKSMSSNCCLQIRRLKDGAKCPF